MCKVHNIFPLVCQQQPLLTQHLKSDVTIILVEVVSNILGGGGFNIILKSQLMYLFV